MRSKQYFFVFLAILGLLVLAIGYDGVRTWRATQEAAAVVQTSH